MASSNAELQDKYKLYYKFTKVLTLKVAQIVVQSRQGKKITHECNAKLPEIGVDSSPQWFNLSIPDEPAVTEDTKRVLNGEVVDALTKVLCIEISLHTVDGDDMVLELWTVKLAPGSEVCSPSTVYYRMSVMLKSTLTISRITPAYKLSRTQHNESYKISHKIYGGEPDYDILGEKRKTVKVSELHTPIGTLIIEVVYRTKMTIMPETRQKIEYATPATNDIMVKSDHFYTESPKKNRHEKKELDLSKPLTAGAFVDTVKLKELHDTLSQRLPPEPPMAWLLAEKEKMENKMKALTTSDHENANRPSCSTAVSNTSAHAVSRAIEVPKNKNNDKYSGLMEFPFADGSPIAELANFYQECLHARSISDEWTDIVIESASTDSESLSKQLKMFEDAVPEFDNMVASMFSNSETGSDRS
ncbi:autophagy-related protein 13 homolog [Anticarsia gemmatalis]|uniref:autophagy-related protein 13 homolog n=1 Tax=Anticarsia gemmatalis TaxID=129554 RepID=UPI003F7623F8